jgi:hypothetical protein
MVEPQQDVTIAHYAWLFPVLGVSWSQSLEVLLYRPGYDPVTVEARPWWFLPGYYHTESVRWERLPDLHAQEQALQRVMQKGGQHFLLLEPELLHFAAAEYERLARCWGTASAEACAHRERLLASAGQCRAQAVEREQRQDQRQK